ncbi:MAG: hypothetical protein ABSF77_18640 [Spirochaetia bacterium]|jgi:hypothetical protein
MSDTIPDRLRWCGIGVLNLTSTNGTPIRISSWQEIPSGLLPADRVAELLATGEVKDFSATPAVPGMYDLVPSDPYEQMILARTRGEVPEVVPGPGGPALAAQAAGEN